MFETKPTLWAIALLIPLSLALLTPTGQHLIGITLFALLVTLWPILLYTIFKRLTKKQ